MTFSLGNSDLFQKEKRGKNVSFSMETSLTSIHRSSNQITEDYTEIKQHLTDISILSPIRLSLYPACKGGPEQTANQSPCAWFL